MEWVLDPLVKPEDDEKLKPEDDEKAQNLPFPTPTSVIPNLIGNLTST